MTSLLQAQKDFLACLHDDSAPLPSGWDARHAVGMAIYRNAYRTRLIDVLQNTFERTARLVGDDAFSQAAAHHLITHPPTAWTIDLAGAGFAETCADLFANDPDVGEVAWLEWAMHCAFTAADSEPLTLSGFAAATAQFDAGQWDELCFETIPGTALRPVAHDLIALWESLADPPRPFHVEKLSEPKWALVWREGEQPVFALVPDAEGIALSELQRGGTFGNVCAELLDNGKADDAAASAGAMLQNWLELGVFRRTSCSL
ncbi:putative DNA-binding domain-containing protein [Novosphingobium sp.]|uniref:HvfC/BufC family peptide modification chaperone n=1 Tax=Novosphingobium sp. TaxID=1874826 RepID=UPI00356919A3